MTLTEREKQTLAFIMSYIEENGEAPMLREIASFLGVSKERARQLVDHLAKKGLVKHEYHKVRSLEVLL